jgi:hypothetical protein
MKFWQGLVNSKKRFLWIIRPDLVDENDGDGQTLTELVVGTKEKAVAPLRSPSSRVVRRLATKEFVLGFFS